VLRKNLGRPTKRTFLDPDGRAGLTTTCTTPTPSRHCLAKAQRSNPRLRHPRCHRSTAQRSSRDLQRTVELPPKRICAQRDPFRGLFHPVRATSTHAWSDPRRYPEPRRVGADAVPAPILGGRLRGGWPLHGSEATRGDRCTRRLRFDSCRERTCGRAVSTINDHGGGRCYAERTTR
jgi:hypothetical protein